VLAARWSVSSYGMYLCSCSQFMSTNCVMKPSWGEVSSFPHACGNTQRLCYYFGAGNGKKTLCRSLEQSCMRRRVYATAIQGLLIQPVLIMKVWFLITSVLTARYRQTNNTNCLRGAESFLRSHQLLSYSRISQHSMEPENSLPCS
jgi:hypothetical protein